MSLPEIRFPALVGSDGTLYQNPDFFARGFCYGNAGVYWLSTGIYTVMADARRGFVRYVDFMNSEAMGNTSQFGPINGPVVDGSAVRIANVADPQDAAKRCWLYRININDPDTAGSGNKRAELSGDFRQMALRNKDGGHIMFFAVRYCDLSTTTTGQQVISQVHASNTNTGCPPWYGMLVGPGNRLFFILRYDPNPITSDSTNVNWIAYDNFFTPNTWMHVVVEYRQSNDTPEGYCRIWLRRQGEAAPTTPIVNYNGMLGYVDNGGYSYLKAGIYHFTEGAPQFAFDAALPTRECWQKGPYQLPIGTVTVAEAFAFLETV